MDYGGGGEGDVESVASQGDLEVRMPRHHLTLVPSALVQLSWRNISAYVHSQQEILRQLAQAQQYML